MKIPKPIYFNAIKHHLEFIAGRVEYFSTKKLNKELIRKELLKIGSSQMDLYTGNLSVEDISSEVLITAKENDILEYDKYEVWLRSENKGYNFLRLSDKSSWTFLMGDDKSRYMHIHPAKKSANVIRVRANTLKTAIVYSFESKIGNFENPDIILLNSIRKEYLEEAPIKSLSNAAGIIKLVSLIGERLIK